MERIAFYGGSFDPPHRAHLAVARAARQALELDKILFAPVGWQPLKPKGGTATFEDRLKMAALAIEGEAGFEVSAADSPLSAGRPNYSYETVASLKQQLGSACELYFLLGADSLANFRAWYRAAELPFLATLVVAGRPGVDLSNLGSILPYGLSISPAPVFGGLRHGIEVIGYELENLYGETARLILLPALADEANATELRAMLEASDSEAETWLPAPVLDYIRAEQLYK